MTEPVAYKAQGALMQAQEAREKAARRRRQQALAAAELRELEQVRGEQAALKAAAAERRARRTP